MFALRETSSANPRPSCEHAKPARLVAECATDLHVFDTVEDLRWKAAHPNFEEYCRRMKSPDLCRRVTTMFCSSRWRLKLSHPSESNSAPPTLGCVHNAFIDNLHRGSSGYSNGSMSSGTGITCPPSTYVIPFQSCQRAALAHSKAYSA